MRCPPLIAGLLALAVVASTTCPASAQVLDKRRLLDAQTYRDNRDDDWFAAQTPFFECPDAEITTTWYYRWELLTKHLTYGSPNSGYSFTEFIDRPFWSGAYGAISCPAGHQLYEARWLRSPRIARDYARYWFRTPGAQPRNYSTWLADSVWALHQVHGDAAFTTDLLDDLVKNYAAWEQRHFVPEVGLFWQTGHDDGMEFNINSRQTKDILRGAPGYRPSFNSYLWADAVAIAKIARLAGRNDVAGTFERKAAALKTELQKRLWDDRREFFLQAYRNDEEKDGHKIAALSKTYETGKHAGDAHGRELIGYVPWQFNLPDPGKGYEKAWRFLMDRERFFADFGPTTVERNDPQFLLQKSCCWWSGQSWPYATTQTLKALANLLQNYEQNVVTKADYLKLLEIYARTHRKNGRPYLAEACHPDTGSFEGHDGYNHSEHYFHSGYCDLVITGLVGLMPGGEASFEVRPLAPDGWDWFALDDVVYQGRRVSVLWDRDGTRYRKGPGLKVLVDGQTLATSPRLEKLAVALPTPSSRSEKKLDAETVSRGETEVNFAVNNDGHYFPRITATYSHPQTPLGKLVDGNSWYMPHPPNRWTCEGSPNETDSVVVDFGVPRPIHTVKLYVLDDGEKIAVPAKIELEAWDEGRWTALPTTERIPAEPAGHRANVFRFAPRTTSRLRVSLTHRPGAKSGLSEIEAWGDAKLPLAPVPPPAGNLAWNPGDKPFPKASASHTSRFDKVEKANDGITNFLPTPNNRWTSYESKSPTDWIEIDFGEPKEVARVELAIYDDRGGVQAPESYQLELWIDDRWQLAAEAVKSPEKPAGGLWNEIRFRPAKTSKLRLTFTHKGAARSGVTEVMAWGP